MESILEGSGVRDDKVGDSRQGDIAKAYPSCSSWVVGNSKGVGRERGCVRECLEKGMISSSNGLSKGGGPIVKISVGRMSVVVHVSSQQVEEGWLGTGSK